MIERKPIDDLIDRKAQESAERYQDLLDRGWEPEDAAYVVDKDYEQEASAYYRERIEAGVEPIDAAWDAAEQFLTIKYEPTDPMAVDHHKLAQRRYPSRTAEDRDSAGVPM